MQRKDWLIGITALALLLLVAWFLVPKSPTSFVSVHDASRRIAAAGFRCTGDRADGQLDNGFLVTREEIKWEDVAVLRKAGPIDEQWKGKVWVAYHSARQIYSVPDQAEVRLWGSVCAFGDGELLAEIEGALRHTREPAM
jgi:hypothetical protein